MAGRRGGRELTPGQWARRNGAALHLPGDGRAPAFGYFPNAKQRTTFAHLTAQAPPYDYALELRADGHAVLAFEYRPAGEDGTPGTGRSHMVQVWTPPVPALTFDTGLKSMLGSIRTDAAAYEAPGTVRTGYPEFDARFTVYCEHPDFARGVLVAPLLRWLLDDPRTPGSFSLLNSVALVQGDRKLVPTEIPETAGFLIDFVNAFPAHTWQYRR
ncbi:hypothetical protein [Amycolatopsis sp. CA-230715]|uniref:hypothetical protein n=1 Tax=Amycolatopsis sp. CA-230715 TaxID=2745196 RepID=UPI001C02C6A5|nr:hypothetical protein [Amycolatopsis sp. CA-230715]QWF79676.1 hypothetical protein HUW46_03085 [Amycolatopsis sp. CA-230715]